MESVDALIHKKDDRASEKFENWAKPSDSIAFKQAEKYLKDTVQGALF